MFDVFIIIVFVWAIISGWRNGLLTELVSLGGHLAGLVVACIVYSLLGKHLAVSGSRTAMILNIVAFFIIWIIVPIVLGLAANTLTHFMKPLHIRGLNNAAGAAISTLKFTILLSAVFAAMTALGILNEEKANDSRLYNPLKTLLAGAVDWAIDDNIRAINPTQGTGTYNGDTLWVDVPHKADTTHIKDATKNTGIKAN